MIISRWMLLRLRNVSDKSCRENQNTHFMFNNSPPPPKSCRLWDNVEKYCTARQVTGDNIIRRMRFACWITKATDTHSESLIFTAFPRQQWLRERASNLMLCGHCLSCWWYGITVLFGECPGAIPTHVWAGHAAATVYTLGQSTESDQRCWSLKIMFLYLRIY
jgi:hypothetical protein